MIQVKKLVLGTALAGLSLASIPTMAAHVPGVGFGPSDFTFDGTNFGGGATIPVKYIDFSYRAEIDQDGVGNFDETGGGFFGTFRETLGGAPIGGSGLGSAFQMYALFSGTGTQVFNGTGIDATFTSFNVEFFIDQNSNTTLSAPALGGVDESVVASNNADDVSILTGSLLVGGAHVFPGLAGGDFDVEFLVNSFDAAVWGGDAFTGTPVHGDFNGVNTQVIGITGPNDPVTDATIIGSGNTSFQNVPEPATLALLSVGLIGLSGLRRRK